MLLNELKQVFETDRDPLASSLNALGINLHSSGHSGTGAGKDVDTSFQPLVADFVVAYDASVNDGQVRALTKTPELYETAIESSAALVEILDKMESIVTTKLSNLKQLEPIAKAQNDSSILDWLTKLSVSLKASPNAPLFATHRDEMKNRFSSQKDALVRNLMRQTSASNFALDTVTWISNFVNGPKFKTDAEPEGTAEGITQIKSMIELFYVMIVTMQTNAKALAAKIAAQKPAQAK